MQNAEFCMFCYYRNKRLAACPHTAARPDAKLEDALNLPPAAAARAQGHTPQPKQPR